MTTAPSRPRLPGRAISDVHPLINEEVNENASDQRVLGRGTHLAFGGIKATSGAKLALGGRLPVSPFLPLPPAPPAEDIKRQVTEQQLTPKARKDGKHDTHISIHLGLPEGESQPCRRASSNGTEQQQTLASRKARQEQRGNAAHMIRSYSLPVATQKEFDMQRQRQCRWQGRGDFVPQQQWSRGWPVPSLQSSSGNGIERSCTTAPSMHPSGLRQQPRSPRAPLSNIDLNSPSSPPRSSLASSLQVPDDEEPDYFSQRDRDSNNSDETEVLTPRALTPESSPAVASKSPTYNAMADVEDVSFVIHPGHLERPAPFEL